MSKPESRSLDFTQANDADTDVFDRTRAFVAREGPAPEWEVGARARLAAAIDRFTGPLSELVARQANEGDTRMLVADFLSDGLNYGKYDSLTTEYRTRGGSVDYGILIDGQPFALIEVKQCGSALDARHMRQAKSHATSEGFGWVVLTNGHAWQVHHLDAGDQDGAGLVIEVDLLYDADGEATVDSLFHLCREAVQNGRLDALRAWREALAPARLAQVLLSGPVVGAIRAELRRRTGHLGHMDDDTEIDHALRENVTARGLLDEKDQKGV